MDMKVIYSDLDGTLLDKDTYSYHEAQKGLQIVTNKGIPLIICSSKTRCEIEYWRKKLCNHEPFISENGGAIFLPKNYFSFDISISYHTGIYDVIELGMRVSRLMDIFSDLKKEYGIKSFLDMDPQEIKDDAHIPLRQAVLAQKREYDIPFKILDLKDKEKIFEAINKKGLKIISGGRYYHLTGNTNKGRAVIVLSGLLKRKYGEMVTIGIGDSENDFSMLDNVDRPYILRRNDGTFASNNYGIVTGIGPSGWTQVIEKELTIDG